MYRAKTMSAPPQRRFVVQLRHTLPGVEGKGFLSSLGVQ